jgi:hypothetical protein
LLLLSLKPESQRDKYRIPDLRIPDIQFAMPVRIKEPTVKWDSGAKIDADHNVITKNGEVLYHSDGEIGDGTRFEVKDPETGESKHYFVKGDGDKAKVIYDSKVRPLTLAGRTLTLAAVANTLLDLAEYDIIENPEALLNYAQDVAEAMAVYGEDILEAIELGDVDFLSEVVGDAVNPVTAVDTVFKRLDAYDIPVLDSVVHPIAEAMNQVDDATKVVTKEVGEPFLNGVEGKIQQEGAAKGIVDIYGEYSNPVKLIDKAAEGVANLVAPAATAVVDTVGSAINGVAQAVGDAFRGLKFW